MEEYLSCQICFHLFGEGVKCPRMLQCGHSFCHSCLDKRMSGNAQRTCPMCNAQISVSGPSALPINYLIKGLATAPNQSLKKIKLENIPSNSSAGQMQERFEGIEKCLNHGETKKFRCMQCVVWICGTCATLNHKDCRTLLLDEALAEIKVQLTKKFTEHDEANQAQTNMVGKFIKICSTELTEFDKEIEEIRARKKTTQEWMSKLVVLKYEQTLFSSNLKALGISEKVSKDMNEFGLLEATKKLEKFMEDSKGKLANGISLLQEFQNILSFQDLMSLCLMGSGMYVVTKQNVDMYGKVTAKSNKLYVHAFRAQKPTGMPIFYPYSDLLNRFNESREFPKRGFLELREESLKVNDKEEKVSTVVGEIVVMVDNLTTPRALNFLTYCSGIKGDSYVTKEINKSSCFGGSYSYTDQGIGTIFKDETKALVSGINDTEIYKAVIKLGSVIGCSKSQPDKLSGFQISCVDFNRVSNAKFGVVEEGMEVCQKVFRSNIRGIDRIVTYFVNDCGLVFSAS